MPEYVAIADGGCYRNGDLGAKAYGSFILYKTVDDVIPLRCPQSCTPTRGLVPEPTPSPESLQAMSNVVKHVDHRPFILLSVPKKTNNLAEAMSLQMLIHYLNEEGLICPGNYINILMDSELVVKQMTGVYAVKAQHLKPIYRNINDILTKTAQLHDVDIKSLLCLRHISNKIVKQILGH